MLDPAVPESVTCFSDGAAVFWQMVFGSMLPGFGVPVCCDCGSVLADSKQGKRSKAERCKRCRYKKWLAGIDPDKRRERTREEAASTC